MQQSHYTPCDISDWGVKSSAQWAVEPAGRAVVFVHGFNGSSVSSWLDFPRMLPLRDECRGHDLIFYGYDSLYTQSNFSAGMLYDFLDRLFADPLSVVNPTIHQARRRAAEFEYERVVLVAHSLGSVVARRALLNAHADGKSWLGKTRLVLFAPAHAGARVQALALSALTGIQWVGGLFAGLLDYQMPPLQELKPGSPTLQNLLADTRDALNAGAEAVKARAVVWGGRDKVVEQQPFPGDPNPIRYPDKGHMEVCKPSSTFDRPVTDLLGIL